MNLEQYTAAKKLFETFDARAVDNDLTIEQAWTNKIATEVRAERDNLMHDTDWIVVKANETSTNVPTAIKNYRQALRDLPSAEGFPHTMAWPTKPA